ncbi:MAG: hypothetical protein IJK25_12235 [Firmicutes bacterium]|nr:hypothetical protein [Bacillota bacterium]
MKIFEVRGTEYEQGFQVGEFFKERLQSQAEKYEKALEKPVLLDFVKGAEAKLAKEFPKLLDEAYGRADGSGLSRYATLLMYSPEVFKKEDGCTTAILQRPDGKFLFSHNEDDGGFCYGNVALVKYVYPDGHWIVGYSVAEKLLGSTWAYNSDGMVFSSNYIAPAVTDLTSISRYYMVRDALNARDLGGVLRRLARLEVASPFSFNAIDTKTCEAVNVEKDVRKIYVTPIRERYARSNHFTSSPYSPIPTTGNTMFRWWKANDLLAKLDPETADIFDVRGVVDFEGPDYMHTIHLSPDRNDAEKEPVTVTNFAFDQEANRFYIRDFLDHEEIIWDYDQFVPNC